MLTMYPLEIEMPTMINLGKGHLKSMTAYPGTTSFLDLQLPGFQFMLEIRFRNRL